MRTAKSIATTLFSSILFFQFSGLQAVEKPEAVNPWDLATNIYSNPTIPYQARLSVSQWRETGTKAEEVEVYFLPPDLYRIEFYSLKGDMHKMVQSDSMREQVTLLSNGRVSNVYTHNRPRKFLNKKDEQSVLQANYKSSITGSDVVMGRPVWIFVLTPIEDGKPISQYKIDKATKMVLELKRSTENDNLGSLTRFIRFEPNKTLSRSLFLPTLEKNTPEDKSWNGQTPLKKEDIAGSGQDWASASELPGGFALNGGNSFQYAGNPINHYFFTDGVLQLSVFKTMAPINLSSAKSDPQKDVSLLSLTSNDQIYSFQSGKSYYTLISEMNPDTLKNISTTFR